MVEINVGKLPEPEEKTVEITTVHQVRIPLSTIAQWWKEEQNYGDPPLPDWTPGVVLSEQLIDRLEQLAAPLSISEYIIEGEYDHGTVIKMDIELLD